MGGVNPHRQKKEEFVSNLLGSSKLEIAALSALVPAFVILRIIGSFYGRKRDDNSDRGYAEFWYSLALDSIYIVLPTVLCLTVLADYVYVVLLAVLLTMGLIFFMSPKPKSSVSVSSLKIPFITHYRFVMMMVTCVTILAVDFQVFPRRYAKTETYGTSLMDLGVGSFVAARGIVSKQAKDQKKSEGIRSVVPLLVLGVARLIATKEVDYQVHVGEYGVHWNFFFTLAAVLFLSNIIHVSPAYSGFFGLAVLAVHQFSLWCGLDNYMLSSKRGSSVMDLNKEGIFSILGYWSLYLLSVRIGQHFFVNPGGIFRRICSPSIDTKWSNLADIWLLDAVMWFLVYLLEKVVEPVSRRTCNVGYVMLVLAQNLEVMGLFALADVFFPSKLVLVEVLDDNLLLTFLVANLFTGLVNMSMDTIYVPSLPSVVVVMGYMSFLIMAIALFKTYNFRLKFR